MNELTTDEMRSSYRALQANAPLGSQGCGKLSAEAKLEYQEAELTDVMKYFTEGFELGDYELLSFDWYLDHPKGKVLFQLTVRPKKHEG